MAAVRPDGVNQFSDNNGVPLVGGKVYTYQTGTTTLQATYNDAAQTSAKTNPIILDAAGRATIFWVGSYKVVVQDSTGVTISTIDPLTSGLSGGDISALGSLAVPGSLGVTAAGQHTGGISRNTAVVLAENVASPDDSVRISPGLMEFYLGGKRVLYAAPPNLVIQSDNGALILTAQDGTTRGFIQGVMGGGVSVVSGSNIALIAGSAVELTGVQIHFFTGSGSTYRGQIDDVGDLDLNENIRIGKQFFGNNTQATPGTGTGREIVQSGGSPPVDGLEGDKVFIY